MENDDNKGKKGWKSLFITGEENKGEQNTASQKTSVKEVLKKTFPNHAQNTVLSNDSSSVFDSHRNSEAQSHSHNSSIDEVILQKVKESYSQNFVKLNKPGYDFYEYFNSVRKAGPDKPGVFSMALDMASAMSDNVTKDLLIAQAKDYVQQINNMHTSNLQKGELKKSEILSNQQTESKNLTVELQTLNEQMCALQTQIEDRQRRLDAVGSKYEPQLHDIEQKMMANDLVKNQMIVELEKVQHGLEAV